MKQFLPFLLVALTTFAAAAAQPSNPPPKHTTSKPSASKTARPAAMASAAKPEATPAVPSKPAPAAPATPAVALATPSPAGVTLDAYLAALTRDVPLTKDEQTDVKTYYLADGTKLQDILNDGSLSPFGQTQQVDALRDSRNARIEALLDDAGKQAQFLQVESDYRVALVELAAQGGLVPGSALPKVPEPTATTPAQAEKTTPTIPRQDAVPGT